MKTKPGLALGTLVPLLLLVGACGIGGSASGDAVRPSGGSSSATSPQDVAAEGPAPANDRSAQSGDRSAAKGSPVAATAPMARAVISTGQVTVHTARINRARAEVIRLVASWNGSVADEQTTSDDHGRVVDSTMTLRVPTARFSEAMDAMAELGRVEQQSRKSEDVTTQVLDNRARVRAAERSILQIERLLDRATQLSEIISIEADLARRQADLDSLKSQQTWLEDQTSLSTINVYLSLPAHRSGEPDEARGFLAGLDDGWSALQGATVAVLTLVGALLPFVAVLALLGVPLWLLARRRRPAPTATAGP